MAFVVPEWGKVLLKFSIVAGMFIFFIWKVLLPKIDKNDPSGGFGGIEYG